MKMYKQLTVLIILLFCISTAAATSVSNSIPQKTDDIPWTADFSIVDPNTGKTRYFAVRNYGREQLIEIVDGRDTGIRIGDEYKEFAITGPDVDKKTTADLIKDLSKVITGREDAFKKVNVPGEPAAPAAPTAAPAAEPAAKAAPTAPTAAPKAPEGSTHTTTNLEGKPVYMKQVGDKVLVYSEDGKWIERKGYTSADDLSKKVYNKPASPVTAAPTAAPAEKPAEKKEELEKIKQTDMQKFLESNKAIADANKAIIDADQALAKVNQDLFNANEVLQDPKATADDKKKAKEEKKAAAEKLKKADEDKKKAQAALKKAKENAGKIGAESIRLNAWGILQDEEANSADKKAAYDMIASDIATNPHFYGLRDLQNLAKDETISDDLKKVLTDEIKKRKEGISRVRSTMWRRITNPVKIVGYYKDFKALAGLFGDDEEIQERVTEIRKKICGKIPIFAGEACWKSKLCEKHVDTVSSDPGMLVTVTPTGKIIPVIHVEGWRTPKAVFINETTGEITSSFSRLYKITYLVVNPSEDDENGYNLLLKSGGNIKYRRFLDNQGNPKFKFLNVSESDGMSGSFPLMFYSTKEYDEVCIVMKESIEVSHSIADVTSTKEVCNTLAEHTGAPTTLEDELGGAGAGSDNQVNVNQDI